MGKIKQFIDNFEVYTVTADVYFPEDTDPYYAEIEIEPEFLTADTVKSVINQVKNIKFRITPNKADLHIYKTYGNDIRGVKYDQLVKSVSLTSKQCRNAWI
jgi:hypothetical protein